VRAKSDIASSRERPVVIRTGERVKVRFEIAARASIVPGPPVSPYFGSETRKGAAIRRINCHISDCDVREVPERKGCFQSGTT
jgi:hypothetical protein